MRLLKQDVGVDAQLLNYRTVRQSDFLYAGSYKQKSRADECAAVLTMYFVSVQLSVTLQFSSTIAYCLYCSQCKFMRGPKAKTDIFRNRPN
jgi:hypothetical protein